MNKEQAKAALKAGNKLTHSSFTPSEYIMKHDNYHLIFEDNVITPNDVFWHLRRRPEYNSGWSIFDETKVVQEQEQLYVVTWTFTCEASGHIDAAQQAEGVFTDFPSSRIVTVKEAANNGTMRIVDLSEVV